MVVEVIFLDDLRSRKLEDPSERIADGGPARSADVEGAGGIGRDVLEVDRLAGAAFRAPVGAARLDDSPGELADRCGGEPYVDEPGTCDFGFLHPVVRSDPRREELAQFARIPPGALGQLHRDVRGPVAVLARPRALHLHDGQLAFDRQSAVGDGGGKFVGDEPTEFFGCHARNSTRRLRHILANGPPREARTRS